MDEAPTSRQFRIGETRAILDDLKALSRRMRAHLDYLASPALQEVHRGDCPNHDVAVANLTLALGSCGDAERQMGIALKVTDTPEPKPAEPAEEVQPEPETL